MAFGFWHLTTNNCKVIKDMAFQFPDDEDYKPSYVLIPDERATISEEIEDDPGLYQGFQKNPKVVFLDIPDIVNNGVFSTSIVMTSESYSGNGFDVLGRFLPNNINYPEYIGKFAIVIDVAGGGE